MHDPEKSDSGIVAMKPMNKAGRPAAELAEPRPGTKGNADQQSTHRTQSRARVTQALGRVRKAARQRKKEQFTSLLHHMNVDLLRDSVPRAQTLAEEGKPVNRLERFGRAADGVPPLRNQKFADLPLEGNGFEPSVPGR